MSAIPARASVALLPNPRPRPPGEPETLARIWAPPRGLAFLTVVNNNYIGVFYVGAAFLFFVLAGVLALVMRTQLAVPDNTLVGPSLYNQLFTMHGTVMMFLFAVPAVEAMGILLLPNMLGRARPAVPAALRLRLLGLLRRRARLLREHLRRPGADRRLVHEPAAHDARRTRPGSTRTSGCSASASSRSRPSPARSRSSSACCARARRA